MWLVRRLHNGTVRRLALLVLAGYVLTGMLLMARGGWRLTRSFVDRKNTELALVRQVEAKVQPDAQLVTFGLTLTFQHYSHLPTYEIYYQDEPSLKASGKCSSASLRALESRQCRDPMAGTDRRKSTTAGCSEHTELENQLQISARIRLI